MARELQDEGAFQIVTFTVKAGGDPSKPTTTNTARSWRRRRVRLRTRVPRPLPKARTSPQAQPAMSIFTKPLLTYSRPKGDYAGAEADPIMVDFWVTNGKITE